VGAALFAFTRVRHDRIPHEAIIGLVYIIAFSMAVLIVQKTEGVEHMEGILVGNLLYVKWSDIIAAAVAYLFIGGFHLLYWKKFLLISEYPEKAFRQGINVRFWDFLFYASFGFVITFSTKIAGVLLVFVFLVAPAIMALLVTKRFGRQLTVGWVMGTLVTVAGLFLSVELDLSPGPTVVAFYGIVLATLAVGVYVFRATDRIKAAAYTGIGIGVVALIGLGVYFEGKLLVVVEEEHDSIAHGHAHGHAPAGEHKRAMRAARLEECRDPSVLEKATLGCVGRGKIERYLTLEDADARLEFAKMKLGESKKKGLGFLFVLLADPETPSFFRSEGFELLKEATGEDFGYNPDEDPPGNAEPLKSICRHLKTVKRGER
jgi:zinc/manganese transport system permease protein